MRFRKGNKIGYGLDFAFYRGVPSGVDFRVDKILPNGVILLVAPGYGDHKNYGNGGVAVYGSPATLRRARRERRRERRRG